MVEKIRENSFYHTKIKEWPEEERPREKLIRFGTDRLSDAELLAILIGSGTKNITALDLAKKLLVEYESLSELASLTVQELSRLKGIGNASSARIMASFELGRRIETGPKKKRVKIDSPEAVVRLYSARLRDLKNEIFLTVLLDSGNKLIRDVTISQGTLNSSIVHPREVFKAAVDNLAAGIILVHNHPSGEIEPSEDDRMVTVQMVKASKIIGIPVLDHIIIGDSRYFSFKERGMI